MKKTRKPNTPGEILVEEFLNPILMTQTAFAKHLGVDFKTVNRVAKGGDLSPELAQKIAAATKTSVEFWLNLQNAVTVWELHQNKKNAETNFRYYKWPCVHDDESTALGQMNLWSNRLRGH